MSNILMIGRGTYYKKIRNIVGMNSNDPRLIVNYGLQGQRLGRWLESRSNRAKWDQAERILNKTQYGNKYECAKAVSVLTDYHTPHSVKHRSDCLPDKKYIAKPYYSLGGRGIMPAEDYTGGGTHYFQESLQHIRQYELRVHAAKWITQESYLCQKRVHEDGNTQLTWNNHTGGSFITVEHPESYNVFKKAQEFSKKILERLGYDFAAIDFIVDEDYNVWFVEANLAPGFTMERTAVWYYNTFRALAMWYPGGNGKFIIPVPPRNDQCNASAYEIPLTRICDSLDESPEREAFNFERAMSHAVMDPLMEDEIHVSPVRPPCDEDSEVGLFRDLESRLESVVYGSSLPPGLRDWHDTNEPSELELLRARVSALESTIAELIHDFNSNAHR